MKQKLNWLISNKDNRKGRENWNWCELILAFILTLGIPYAIFLLSLLSLRLSGSRCDVQPPTVPLVLTVKEASENSEEGGAQNGQITITREPFLSLSSYIIPIFLPVPNGYYVINIALNDIIIFVLARISNDLVTSPILNYLVYDWDANFRKDQLIDLLKNIRDRMLLLQIDFVRILYFYVKLFQGPEKCSDSDWFKKENLLNQKKEKLNVLLGVRSIGPARVIFTRHGDITVWPRLNDNSIKSEIKERSKFPTKKLKRFFNKTYRRWLNPDLPWMATFELGPGFLKRLEQSCDHLQLVYRPILGAKAKDYLLVDIFDERWRTTFNPHKKQIKMESIERNDSVVLVLRMNLVHPWNYPQTKSFGIRIAVKTRGALHPTTKLGLVAIFWWYWHFI